MSRFRWFPLLLAPLALCSSCFRAASVDPNELQQLQVEQGSATMVYRNGDSHRIAHFDSLTVHTNAPPPDEPHGAGDRTEFEFDDRARGALSAPLLHLEDRGRRHVFAVAQVQKITLESYSPERPWLILAAASVGAVAGGALGYAMGGSCNEEWGCIEKGLYGLAGVPIGIGIGLAFSVPLTRGLGDFYPAPSGPDPSTERER